jgi:hypothetical protein
MGGKQMLKHYAKYGFVDFFMAEYKVEEIESRDNVPRPPRAFGYTLFDRREECIDGVMLKSEPLNRSGWFYWGKEITKEKAEGILRDNMDINEWDRVVCVTNGGACYPLAEGDVILSE